MTEARRCRLGRGARWAALLVFGIVGFAVGRWSSESDRRPQGKTDAPYTQFRFAPLAVGNITLTLPEGSRISDRPNGAYEISWAPSGAKRTRCGFEATALVETAPSQPVPGGFFTACGIFNPFEGGSGDGDCPLTTVCFANHPGRALSRLTCASSDGSCETVAAAFSGVSVDGKKVARN